jgi:hypothetical protein
MLWPWANSHGVRLLERRTVDGARHCDSVAELRVAKTIG